ncbi:NagC family transcriptional regulator [Neosynechococcus sphagnicola sy1]|uniref:NagC family transcriptional regulator n=1 Tax=Neosynechococcus sphagnicola sy1 TaxID=1497020 RepID=A0A098TK11_9CYAN|nr:response regulator transcription factor [Neosynechococcus sphagnicola]KGF72606.1 NagC family transcriptional regulator [Neosynechococcus sphagnicola sy1]
MSANPLRILLAEDDELFRLGLRIRLQQESNFEVVAEAEDGEMAVEMAKRLPIDIVVLDIGLPGIGGIEACRQLKQQHADLPILVLTSRTQASLVSRLVEAGAQGYCLKGIASETLILAIRSVAAGASWWDAAATTEIRAAFENQPTVIATNEASETYPVLQANPLTRREQEILALIVVGKSNQEIAGMLHITAGTVRVHVHAILNKLNVSDRTQATALAMQKKFIAKELYSDQGFQASDLQ